MIEYLLMLLFILLSGFFSGSEIAFYRSSPIRLRLRTSTQALRKRILQSMTGEPRMTINTILIGNNITHYVVVALCTSQMQRIGVRGADFWSTLILSPVLLVFAEILPKVIFERRPHKLMIMVAPFIKACGWLFYPLLLVVRCMLSGLYYVMGQTDIEKDTFTIDKFKFFLEKSTHGGVITPYQHRMAANIMRLKSLDVGECLVPLSETVMVPAKATMEDLESILQRHRFSRLPVFSEDRAQIIGIINVIDLLSDNDMSDVASLSRDPVRIERELSIVEGLYALQRAQQQMAVVTDAEGESLGIVTVKDLIERIVGEVEAW